MHNLQIFKTVAEAETNLNGNEETNIGTNIFTLAHEWFMYY